MSNSGAFACRGGTEYFPDFASLIQPGVRRKEQKIMNGIIYLVGLVVVVLAILSFLGLR